MDSQLEARGERVKNSLSFDAESHTYYLDGVKIPSVTQVIRSAGLSDYSHVDPAHLADLAERGTYVHEATELLDRGELDDDSIAADAAPYLAGYRSFLRDVTPDYILIEERLASIKHRYAGTIDRLAKIGGRLRVLDIKTGTGAEWHKIQLAAYAVLLREAGHKPMHGTNLYLHAAGTYTIMTYRLVDLKAEESCFLSALNVWKWKMQKGYYNGKS